MAQSPLSSFLHDSFEPLAHHQIERLLTMVHHWRNLNIRCHVSNHEKSMNCPATSYLTDWSHKSPLWPSPQFELAQGSVPIKVAWLFNVGPPWTCTTPPFSVSQNWHVAFAPMLALGCVTNVSSFPIKANNFELTLQFRPPLMSRNKCTCSASPSDTVWNVHTKESAFAERYNTTNNTKEQVPSTVGTLLTHDSDNP